MKLYEIDQAIMNCIDPESGEVLDEQALEELQMEKNEKIENVGLWIKNLIALDDAIENEIKALEDRLKPINNKIESLKTFMQIALNGENFQTGKIAISWRKSESISVSEDAHIPDMYLTVVPELIKPNKTLLKKAIKDGIEIDGVELVAKNNMQIK